MTADGRQATVTRPSSSVICPELFRRLLRRSVIRIRARTMISRVEYLADLRHLLSNQSLDPHLQGHIRRATALTPAAHSYEYVVVLNIQQLNEPPARSHSRIDHLVED